MKLRFIGIRGVGNLDEERIVFIVDGEGDVGRFLTLVSSRIAPDTISAKLIAPYWFPEKKVKDKDLVVVYTKNGRLSTTENADKSQSHFFYRGEESPLFVDGDKCAVVFEIAGWSTTDKRY